MGESDLLTKLFENDGAGPKLRSDIVPYVEQDDSGEKYDDIFFGGDYGDIDSFMFGVSTTLVIPPNANCVELCYVDICYSLGYYPADSIPVDNIYFGVYPVGYKPDMGYWSFVTDTEYPGVADGEHIIVYANGKIYTDSTLQDKIGVPVHFGDRKLYTLSTDGMFGCRGKASRIVWGLSGGVPGGSSIRRTEYAYARLYYD